MYNDVRAHIQEMLDIGAICKSHSPWASVVVLVWKKDGGLRFCIDLRKLNEWTIKDAYSLPQIDETLDSLQGSQWFSSLDLKSGYWQIRWQIFSPRNGDFRFLLIHSYSENSVADQVTDLPPQKWQFYIPTYRFLLWEHNGRLGGRPNTPGNGDFRFLLIDSYTWELSGTSVDIYPTNLDLWMRRVNLWQHLQ